MQNFRETRTLRCKIHDKRWDKDGRKAECTRGSFRLELPQLQRSISTSIFVFLKRAYPDSMCLTISLRDKTAPDAADADMFGFSEGTEFSWCLSRSEKGPIDHVGHWELIRV